MTTMNTPTQFPIRTLVNKTQVGSSTLRAWERRYGLLTPSRTPKGHRLYSEADVKKVRRICDLINDGHSLAVIKDLLAEEKNSTDIEWPLPETKTNHFWHSNIENTLQAIKDLSIERIDSIFNEAIALYPIELVIHHLLEPVLEKTGKLWLESPKTGIAQEHFYTTWLKSRLSARFQHSYAQARGEKIICACVPGCEHEIGLMLFALAALARGYQVHYFGPNLPLDQLNYIQSKIQAKALVLSIHKVREKTINNALLSLIKQHPTQIFIGGSSVVVDTQQLQQSGGIVIGSQLNAAMRLLEYYLPVFAQQKT